MISMLHHFLEYHSLGETSVHFHADNCAGQNKNRYLMYYLTWRVLIGFHDEIIIFLLPIGHTKVLPDWCFGLLKRLLRRMKIGCLDDVVSAVNKSATPNHAQLVGAQDGSLCLIGVAFLRSTQLKLPQRYHKDAPHIFKVTSWESDGQEQY